MTRLQSLGILFSSVVIAALVAKLAILGILPLLALRVGLVTKFVISGTPFFYKQSLFDPRPENCSIFSKELPQKII